MRTFGDNGLAELEAFEGSELSGRIQDGVLLGYVRLGGTAVWLARISIGGKEYKVPLEDIYRAGDLNQFLPPNELPVPDAAELQRERDRINTSLGISASLDRQARYDRYLAYFKETALPLATLPMGLAPAWIVWRAATDQLSSDVQYSVDAAADISEKLFRAANKIVGEGLWALIKPWLPWIIAGGAVLVGVQVILPAYLSGRFGELPVRRRRKSFGDLPGIEANLEKYLADKFDSFDKDADMFSEQLSHRPACQMYHDRAHKALVEAKRAASKDKHIAATYFDAAHSLSKEAMWSCIEGGKHALHFQIQANFFENMAKRVSRGDLDFRKALVE